MIRCNFLQSLKKFSEPPCIHTRIPGGSALNPLRRIFLETVYSHLKRRSRLCKPLKKDPIDNENTNCFGFALYFFFLEGGREGGIDN